MPRHRVLLKTDGLHGVLEVTEAEGVRYLFADGVLQTAAYGDPDKVAKQCHIFCRRYWLELLPYFCPEGQRCLLIGLGGGLLPAVLSGYGIETHSVEIDPTILEVARKYFGYKQGATVCDGREYLAASSQRYDFVVIDAFAGAKFPYSLGSRECFALTEKRLTPSGVLALNVVSKPTGSRVSASVVQSLKTVYPYVLVYRTDAPEKVQPLICFASKKPLSLTLHPHGRELGVTAGQLESLMEFTATPSSSEAVVLMDGHNPLDREWSIETSQWKRRMTDLFGRR